MTSRPTPARSRVGALTGAALAALLLAAAASAAAGPAAAAPTASAPAGPSEVRAWLMRIHDAAGRRNYRGTFVVSGGGSVSSARIAHFCEGKNQWERSESLDGQARHVFRHNELVYTVWPGTRLVRVEQRQVQAAFPALLQAGADRIVDLYDVTPQGADRVAGHDANVLLVTPKDAHRYGYRLWAANASNLLLRVDVLAKNGEVLETSAFSDVAIDIRPQPDTVLQPIRKLEGYQVMRPVLEPTELAAQGWSLQAPVAGFQQVSCVKRPMDGSTVGEKDGGAEQAVQVIYSDGLTYVSVFIEPFAPGRHRQPMTASVGATQTMMKRHGDWWITLVGDVPPATLKLFANGLERKR